MDREAAKVRDAYRALGIQEDGYGVWDRGIIRAFARGEGFGGRAGSLLLLAIQATIAVGRWEVNASKSVWAALLGIDKRDVRKHLRRLEQHGWILFRDGVLAMGPKIRCLKPPLIRPHLDDLTFSEFAEWRSGGANRSTMRGGESVPPVVAPAHTGNGRNGRARGKDPNQLLDKDEAFREFRKHPARPNRKDALLKLVQRHVGKPNRRLGETSGGRGRGGNTAKFTRKSWRDSLDSKQKLKDTRERKAQS